MTNKSGVDLLLEFEPENELGVVLLFGKLASERYEVMIREASPGFPDCIGIHDGKQIRIEFEYKSRNFSNHGHNPRDCDWIVCWIDNWPECPSNIKVIELRKEFGLGFSVWVVPISGVYREKISVAHTGEIWSAPRQASAGDLVLFYRTSPDKFLKDLFIIEEPEYVQSTWKKGKDWMAELRKRIARLEQPVHLNDLRTHEVLKNAGFVRAGFRSRYRATPYWPNLRDLIVRQNPKVEKSFERANL